MFDFLHDREQGLPKVTCEEVANEYRVNDGLAILASLGRGTSHEGRPFSYVEQSVIAAGDESFTKNDQRELALDHGLDGTLEGSAVHSLAVDAEGTDAWCDEALEHTVHEHMPARHDAKWPAHLLGEGVEDQGVARSEMVGYEDDPVPCFE